MRIPAALRAARDVASCSILAAVIAFVAVGCREASSTGAEQRPPPRRDQPRTPVVPRSDPGSGRARVNPSPGSTTAAGASGGGGGGGRAPSVAERRAERLTEADLLARFRDIGESDRGDDLCEQAFAAVSASGEGMAELLEMDEAGAGPGRQAYLTLCRSFDEDVQRCLTPAGQRSAECEEILQRFASNRDDPAWLRRLTGGPTTDRPEPWISAAEARARNRNH